MTIDSALPFVLALGSNLFFAVSSLVFTHYSHKISPLWMNATKAFVACCAFSIAFYFFSNEGLHEVDGASVALWMVSGLLGLNIADWFLLRAFTILGTPRTLMLFGFQPLFLGIAGYFIFQQSLSPLKLVALIFLLGCLYTISLEGFKKTGHWQVKGLLIGLLAISLDGLGVIMTRLAFEYSQNAGSMTANMLRSWGAVAGFVALSVWRPFGWFHKLKTLNPQQTITVLMASVGGTFLSLFLYLWAIKTGPIALVSGVAITSPLFAGIAECFFHKHWPSRYLIFSFVLFSFGFAVLLFA